MGPTFLTKISIDKIFEEKKVCRFYGRCPEGIGRHNVKMSVPFSLCHVPLLKPLIGRKRECYIVEEGIEVDELDEGHLISAAAGKQRKKIGG